MALAELPRIERLDLATVTLPADHPAADLGRLVAVHGFLIDHPDGPILVDPIAELQAAAVESIRRLKALRPEVVHLSHCAAHVLAP